MVKKVYKYEILEIGVPQEIASNNLLHFEIISGKMYVWGEHSDTETATVCIFGTGWHIPDTYGWFGTCVDAHDQFIGSPFVWHAYMECEQ